MNGFEDRRASTTEFGSPEFNKAHRRYDACHESCAPFCATNSVSRLIDGEALRKARKEGYLPIEDYGIIGNLRTCALVSLDSSIDSLCVPNFDSPSIFCRLLDRKIGGYWQIRPKSEATPKQSYLPNTAILGTKWLNDEGVINIIDYMPRPRPSLTGRTRSLHLWLVRRIEAVRGSITTSFECFPAFNYARDTHTTEIDPKTNRVIFTSNDNCIELLAIGHKVDDLPVPEVKWNLDQNTHATHLGPGVTAELNLEEGQVITFIMRKRVAEDEEEAKPIKFSNPDQTLSDTSDYWTGWLNQCKYSGRWREFMQRSAITLKLLTFEPTGAIVAAPTFSLPESIGGTRNWDYRYCWVRDASFSVYALIRLGFTAEADAYMNFMKARLQERKKGENMKIMYSIHGRSDLEELELDHLSGYRDSKPVRIGNGAADHLQLDVAGELMDSIYLHCKFSKPPSWSLWNDVRQLADYVCDSWDQPDMSIWEVRSRKMNYVYSKVMMWVALNRALRLADKRSLPCPNRDRWLKTMDTIYEEVMEKGWSEEKQHFKQSYESDALDSSILIMPMVFFISPTDPRFISTLQAILKSPEKGGLTANSLVFRYDVSKSEDGIEGGGEEGAFAMCTLWCIEALTRVAQYGGSETGGGGHSAMKQARRQFEELLSYGNHLHLFAEEISRSGEFLGNMPQAFTHVSAISTAFNLDRALGNRV